MEKQLPIDNCDPYATFETLDKARADASQKLAKWETRVANKVQNVKENLAISITGARQAATALEVQISTLHEKHDEYTQKWNASNEVVRAKFQLRITMLEEKCRLTKPILEAASTVIAETEVPGISALQEALAAAQGLVVAQKEAMEAAEQRYLQMEARLAAFLPNKSADEQSALIDFGTGTRNPGTPNTEALGETTADLSSTVLSDVSSDKGKGKGKDKGNANY
jgi:flagellar biosynthesis chaperone FliJ